MTKSLSMLYLTLNDFQLFLVACGCTVYVQIFEVCNFRSFQGSYVAIRANYAREVLGCRILKTLDLRKLSPRNVWKQQFVKNCAPRKFGRVQYYVVHFVWKNRNIAQHCTYCTGCYEYLSGCAVSIHFVFLLVASVVVPSVTSTRSVQQVS